MAAVEHCLFCFETLASHLEDRKSMTLAEVEKSWAEYVTTTDDVDSKLAKRLPALRRLAGPSSSSSGSSSPSSASSTTSLQVQQGESGVSTPATSISSTPPPPLVRQQPITESPLFITWNTLSTRHEGHSLRGCIGTFEPQPIEDGLSSYALTSALHDTRFHPITASELPTLQVAVTLLTDFEDAHDTMDWELGKHGIRISFYYHGRRYGATYLPDVATEQGWTKEETIVSLMRKAGWVGRKDKWHEIDVKVVRYQGKKECLDYAEYKKWRDWAGSK